MLLLARSFKTFVVAFGLSLLAACGDTNGSGDADAHPKAGMDAAVTGAKTVMIADLPNACDVLTRDLAASVLQRSAEEIQSMDRPGKGMDEPCTWYFASNPAVGVEQQLTLVIGAPPLTYVNSERDDTERMRSRLNIIASIRDTEVEYLGEQAGGRLYAADRGSRSQLFFATGIRALESAQDEPVGEVLIKATLNEDRPHEERVERLRPVVESAATAL